MIIIHKYRPTWPDEFAAIGAALAETLGSLALQIDHIGSTSVPGLGAKDVIDVQITVAALTSEIRDRMVAAGYVFKEALTHDHVPAGEDDDPRLWTKMVFMEPPGRRRANLHVRINGNPNQQYALLFRDYLRAHPRAVKAIELIKREIVKRHAEDVDAYYDIKDPVYDLIWVAALGWAQRTDWAPTRS